MKHTLNNFGFPNLDLGMENNHKKSQNRKQSTFEDFTKFICPISRLSFDTKFEHDSNCIYRYCKDGTLE